MTAVDPAVPVSEPGAKGLREAVEALANEWDTRAARRRVGRTFCEGPGRPRDDVAAEASIYQNNADRLRSLIAAHTPEGAEGEREVCTGFVVLNLNDAYFDGQTLPEALADYQHVHSATGVCVKRAPAEPDAGDVEALDEVLSDLPTDPHHYARLILASDWLAATADRARRKGAVEAGERIAQAIERLPLTVPCPDPIDGGEHIYPRAAEQVRADAARIARADRLDTP